MNAGLAYTQAKDAINAERVYRDAITRYPTDPRPYQQLTTTIYGARKDLAAAKEIVAQGIRNGAPPVPLYLTLAEAAQKAESPDDIKAALNSAKTEVEKTAKNGDDPYPLYIELADGARQAGDREARTRGSLSCSGTSTAFCGHSFSIGQCLSRTAKFRPRRPLLK